MNRTIKVVAGVVALVMATSMVKVSAVATEPVGIPDAVTTALG